MCVSDPSQLQLQENAYSTTYLISDIPNCYHVVTVLWAGSTQAGRIRAGMRGFSAGSVSALSFCRIPDTRELYH